MYVRFAVIPGRRKRGEMGDAMHGMRGVEERGGAQIDPLDRIIAEMVVEPRPPGRAQRIAGLQDAAQPGAGAAAHQPEMAAALLRHQFENDARLAKPPHAEHDAFIGPLHGMYVVPLSSFRDGPQGRARDP